jgi:DNA-binding transcriptional regulator YiaG
MSGSAAASAGNTRAAAFAQLQRYAPALQNPPLLVVCDLARMEIHTNWTNTVSHTPDDEIDRAALDDPDAQLLSNEQLARAFRPKALIALRKRLGLSQAEFARQFMLNLRTLQGWEQGVVRPKILRGLICA